MRQNEDTELHAGMCWCQSCTRLTVAILYRYTTWEGVGGRSR